jgi:hypothetical protein
VPTSRGRRRRLRGGLCPVTSTGMASSDECGFSVEVKHGKTKHEVACAPDALVRWLMETLEERTGVIGMDTSDPHELASAQDLPDGVLLATS